MTRSIRLTLRPGERIYVNGAVLRVDRKVSLELLNDATFLLEGHVMQMEDATTPLRQLYFVVQAILMDPGSAERTVAAFKDLHAAVILSFDDENLVAGLRAVDELVSAGKPFEALRTLRWLFDFEPCQQETPVGERAIAPTEAA